MDDETEEGAFPVSTTEHTERPMAVTGHTESVGDKGQCPRSSVSSVCREAASVCSVVKSDGGGFYCPDERIISNSAEFVNGEG